MALQKRLFCTVKVPVLRCNIGSFEIIDSWKWFSLQPKPTIARAETNHRQSGKHPSPQPFSQSFLAVSNRY